MKKIGAFLLFFCVLLGLPTFFACEQSEFLAHAAGAETLRQTAEQNKQSACFVVTANSAVVFASANFSAEKIATLKHKDEILVVANDGAPVEEFWNAYKFLKINLEQNGIESENFEFGFVYADLLSEKQEEIVAIPNFNARTNKECKVFAQENGAFVETETTLVRGEKIFLYEGFDSKKTYTAISYVLDGKVFYGFLKTEDVSPNGINPVIVTCVVLISAVLSIIFAWVFIKGKHVKLKKPKPGKYDLKEETPKNS